MTTTAPRVDHSRSILSTGWGLFSRGSVFFVFKWPAFILIGGAAATVLLWLLEHPVWFFVIGNGSVLIWLIWLWIKAGREMKAERLRQ